MIVFGEYKNTTFINAHVLKADHFSERRPGKKFKKNYTHFGSNKGTKVVPVFADRLYAPHPELQINILSKSISFTMFNRFSP